jgi:hypothetical protein
VSSSVVIVASSASASTVPGTTCALFPADNVWHTRVDQLPVNSASATWLGTMKSSTTLLHPDLGPKTKKKFYGMPWQVAPTNAARTSLKFQYASESDAGPYPFTATTPIELGTDRHAVMVDGSTCTLYELYHAHYKTGGKSKAGSGAIWSLGSNALRAAGKTSADAAGLPILPGVLNPDEIASGAVTHAIRFTAACTSRAYVWPARHQAGQANASCPPMGARFRLKAGYSLPASSCATACQTVVTAMKRYGLILADNGSNWYYTGTADPRWTATQVSQLKQIPASQFEAVDESCLQVSAASGQAYQPGSAEFTARCS